MLFEEFTLGKLCFLIFRQLKMISRCCSYFSYEVLYISMSSRYVKQKLKPDNTCDIKWQNTPGMEHIVNRAMFQCHFPLVVAKAVFSFASGVKPM